VVQYRLKQEKLNERKRIMLQQHSQPLTMLGNNERLLMDWKECLACGDDIRIERWQLGYRFCLFCGEDQARAERASWTIIQEYTKGNYMLVTPANVHTTLKQTNPKENRA